MKIPKVGRPLKFQSVEEMEKLINAYFESCFKKNEDTGEMEQVIPFTVTGLAIAIGTDRKGLCEYGDRPEFSNAIKKAKSYVENYAEQNMYTARNPAGAIFALKNFGWRDKQETEITGAGGAPLQVAFAIARPNREEQKVLKSENINE